MKLAKKGLFLLIVPCSLQVLFLTGLEILQWDTEMSSRRSQQEHEVDLAHVQFMQSDLRLLRCMDHWLSNKTNHLPRCLVAAAALDRKSQRVSRLLSTLAVRRASVMGVNALTFDLATMKAAYAQSAAGFKNMSRLSQSALTLVSRYHDSYGMPSATSDYAKAKLAIDAARTQLSLYTGQTVIEPKIEPEIANVVEVKIENDKSQP